MVSPYLPSVHTSCHLILQHHNTTTGQKP